MLLAFAKRAVQPGQGTSVQTVQTKQQDSDVRTEGENPYERNQTNRAWKFKEESGGEKNKRNCSNTNLVKCKPIQLMAKRVIRLAVDPNDSLYQEDTETDPDSTDQEDSEDEAEPSQNS